MDPSLNPLGESTSLNLKTIFQELNATHFNGELQTPALFWNRRFTTASGRFSPKRRNPSIDIAWYLLEEPQAEALVRDTLAHEMIHYWLWTKGLPYGHTPEFHRKMKEIGCSRYNTVPRLRPSKYLYSCPACRTEYPARKRLRSHACLKCCREHSRGKYDARFKLSMVKAERQ